MIEGFALPVSEAFIEVTVLVAVMIGLFAYLQHRLGDRMTRFLLTHWRSGPLMGALAGVIPGCGGAILVVPLFVRSRVSFGTLIAALVATMGDASFVIIAADPRLALYVHATLFVAGLASGVIVDLIGYSPRPKPDAELGCACAAVCVHDGGRPAHACGRRLATHASDGTPGSSVSSPAGGVALAARSEVLVEAVPTPARRWVQLGVRLGPAVLGFYLFVLVGTTIMAPVTLQRWEPLQLPRLIGGVDPFLTVGIGGTLMAYLVARRARRERRGVVASPRVPGLAGVLRDAAQESARVTVWLAVAFTAIEVTTNVGFAVAGALSVIGLAGVLVGALFGLIPGCAPQIVLTGLYVSGTVPFATLLSNALSQDGDALLPLILMDRRSAVVASVLTTIPGLIGGTVALVVGVAP